ncbi:Ribonuclease H-like domain containing protein [Trema orientale]|uniref:Ribonuclease H-like domain containing protein n=1 Tax=Trema orientale TaxID=63057 RepID=A0A2P5EZY6_TREOI|nr:Ribonuclease H-like domain containing protein [Trema orientale]
MISFTSLLAFLTPCTIDPIQLRKDCYSAYLEMSLIRQPAEPLGTLMEQLNVPQWSPPETGFVKVSTDASFAASKCGLAGIFRDDAGSVLLLTFKSGSANSPFEAECMAIWLALTCALEEGWSILIVESDATILVNSLQNGKYPPEWKSFVIFFNVVNLCNLFDSISLFLSQDKLMPWQIPWLSGLALI